MIFNISNKEGADKYRDYLSLYFSKSILDDPQRLYEQ